MRQTFTVACIASFVIAIGSSIPALTVLQTGHAWTMSYGSITYSADSLSAFMVLLINTGAVLAALFGISYLASDHTKRSVAESLLHAVAFVALHVAMVGVVLTTDLFSLFLFWETMSIASFLLVLLDARQTRVRNSAIRYLVQMHIGALGLLIAIATLYATMGDTSFASLHVYVATHPVWTIMLPLGIAFAMKAGLFPMHSWLPDTHAAAPSHVSGLMSGVMIKLGVYGLIRAGLAIGPTMDVGVVLLVLGMITALFGISNAIVQRDLKRLLAYSSVENMGLIVMSVGMAFIARVMHLPAIEVAAWSAVVLHMIHHMLMKAVLFQSAGNILHGTHTRDLNSLGGLVHVMPGTVNLLILGSLGICALPGLSGFASEFPMYIASINSMISTSTLLSTFGVFSVLTLCLAGGLAIVAFTKAVGIGALGSPRSKAAESAHEVSLFAHIPQWIAIMLSLFMTVAPGVVIRIFSGVIFSTFGFAVSEDLLSTLDIVGKGQGVLIAGIAGVWLLRRFAISNKPLTAGPTWGCGFTEGDARVQYTATTYADSTVDIGGSALGVHRSFRPIAAADMFPHTRSYHTEEHDVVTTKLINPPSAVIDRFLRSLGVLQTGDIRTYILYAFVF
ncbi:MAG: proton-conducting transporter membrane subunit, partial [Candidatus Kapabacteria bacterium]|nr:proton-conducting transporter membrane subunit [Candidatus Kapabacteria bacterium]